MSSPGSSVTTFFVGQCAVLNQRLLWLSRHVHRLMCHHSQRGFQTLFWFRRSILKQRDVWHCWKVREVVTDRITSNLSYQIMLNCCLIFPPHMKLAICGDFSVWNSMLFHHPPRENNSSSHNLWSTYYASVTILSILISLKINWHIETMVRAH